MNPVQPAPAASNTNAAQANLRQAPPAAPQADRNQLQHIARAVETIAAAAPLPPPMPARAPIQREVAVSHIHDIPQDAAPAEEIFGAAFLQTSPGPIPERGQDLGPRSRFNGERCIVDDVTAEGRIVYRGDGQIIPDGPRFPAHVVGPFAPTTIAEYRERLDAGDTFRR